MDDSKFMVLSPLKPAPRTVKMLPSLHQRIFLVPVSRTGRTNFCSWHLPPGKRFAEQSLILLTVSPRDLSKTSGPTCIDWLLHALDGKKLWRLLAKTSLQAKAGTDYTNSNTSRNNFSQMTPSYKTWHFMIPESKRQKRHPGIEKNHPNPPTPQTPTPLFCLNSLIVSWQKGGGLYIPVYGCWQGNLQQVIILTLHGDELTKIRKYLHTIWKPAIVL